jgi:uncharacterized protein YjbJ (UPF0337 family)
VGLDDTLKQQLRTRLQEVKPRLVQEFDELTDADVDEAGNDPDRIVDKIQRKTGQPRDQVEQRVRSVMQG